MRYPSFIGSILAFLLVPIRLAWRRSSSAARVPQCMGTRRRLAIFSCACFPRRSMDAACPACLRPGTGIERVADTIRPASRSACDIVSTLPQSRPCPGRCAASLLSRAASVSFDAHHLLDAVDHLLNATHHLNPASSKLILAPSPSQSPGAGNSEASRAGLIILARRIQSSSRAEFTIRREAREMPRSQWL